LLYLVEIDHFDLNMTVRAKNVRRTKGTWQAKRGNQNVEGNFNPNANMWAQMMQQIQQNAQSQQQWVAAMQQGPCVHQ
jgi:hypothetical protein